MRIRIVGCCPSLWVGGRLGVCLKRRELRWVTGARVFVRVEDGGPGHAESLVMGSFRRSCLLWVVVRLGWRMCLLGKLLTVLGPSSASRDLKAVVCRRRYLTILLPHHGLGELLPCRP